MSKFNTGDKVIINGALVAEILTYDEGSDRIAYVTSVGGGTNTVYDHISKTRVDAFPTLTTEEDVVVVEKAKGQASE